VFFAWRSHLVCFADTLAVGNCHCRLDKKSACHQSLRCESLCRAEGVGKARNSRSTLNPWLSFVQYIVVCVGVHRSPFICQSLPIPTLSVNPYAFLPRPSFAFCGFCSCTLGGVCPPRVRNMARCSISFATAIDAFRIMGGFSSEL
jgi:hypothetical protein